MELKLSSLVSFKAITLTLIILSLTFLSFSYVSISSEGTSYVKRIAVIGSDRSNSSYHLIPILVHHVEDKSYISPMIFLSDREDTCMLETFLGKDLLPEFKGSEIVSMGNLPTNKLTLLKTLLTPKEQFEILGENLLSESISLMRKYWRKASHVVISYMPEKCIEKVSFSKVLNISSPDAELLTLSGNLMENTQRFTMINVEEYTLAICNLTWTSPLSVSDVDIVFYDPDGQLAFSKYLPLKEVFSGSRDAAYVMGKNGRWRIGAYCRYMKYLVQCSFKLSLKLVKGYSVNVSIPKNCFLLEIQAESNGGKYLLSSFHSCFSLLEKPTLLSGNERYLIYFPPHGDVSITVFPLSPSSKDGVRLNLTMYLMDESAFVDLVMFLNSVTLSSLLNSPLIVVSDSATIDDIKPVLDFPVEDSLIIVDAKNRSLTKFILETLDNVKLISSLWELFNYAARYAELNYIVLTIPNDGFLTLSTYIASAKKGIVLIPPPYSFETFSDLSLLWKDLLYSSDSIGDVKMVESAPPFSYMVYYASELLSSIESLLPLHLSKGAFITIISPLSGIPPLVDRCLIGKHFVGRIAEDDLEKLSIHCSRILLKDLLLSKFFSSDVLLSMISFSYGLQIHQFFNNTVRKLPFDSSKAYPGSIEGAGLDLVMHTSPFKVLQALKNIPRLFIYLGPSINGTSMLFFEPDSHMAFERLHGTGSSSNPDIDINYIVKPLELEPFDVRIISASNLVLSSTVTIISANCSAQWEFARHFIEAGSPIYFGLLSCCKLGYSDKIHYIFLTQLLSGKSAGEAFNASVAIGLLHVYSTGGFSAIDRYEESRGVPSTLLLLYGDPSFRIPFGNVETEVIDVEKFDLLPSQTLFLNIVSLTSMIVIALIVYLLVLESCRKVRAVI